MRKKQRQCDDEDQDGRVEKNTFDRNKPFIPCNQIRRKRPTQKAHGQKKDCRHQNGARRVGQSRFHQRNTHKSAVAERRGNRRNTIRHIVAAPLHDGIKQQNRDQLRKERHGKKYPDFLQQIDRVLDAIERIQRQTWLTDVHQHFGKRRDRLFFDRTEAAQQISRDGVCQHHRDRHQRNRKHYFSASAGQSAPSVLRKKRLISAPAENPPKPPFAVTRWHGIRTRTGFLPRACPTARAARGIPIALASCPYETDCPYPTARAASQTARQKDVPLIFNFSCGGLPRPAK